MKNRSSAVGSHARPRAMLIVEATSLLALLASLPAVAGAADNFWIGGAANGNFSDNANWQSPPSWGFGNSLIFSANTSAPTLTNNNGVWRDNNDIVWDTTFPVARTLQSTGNFGLGFKIRLENKSSFTQTVTMPLSGGLNGAGQIQLNPVNGSLVLDEFVYNDDSVDYAVFGSQTATVTNLTLNKALGPNATQTNIDFSVAGGRNTAIQVNASQLWEGTTDVQSGSFTTANGVTLASKAILVSGGTVATTSANTLADAATLTVNTGRLSIGGSDTVGSLAGSGGTVDLAAGATLTAGGANTNTSYAGSIGGSGSLRKLGSGTFTLTGSNSYSGDTTIGGGRLVAAAATSLQGNVVNNAELEFAVNGSSVTFGSTISGSGALIKSGTGALSLGAANSYSGGTVVAAGRLLGDPAALQGAIANSGVVVLGTGSAGTFAGTVSGTGAVEVAGGNIAFTAASTYTGATTVFNGARLALNGSLGNTALTVNGGGTLSGTGTVGGSTTIAGIHSPGNSPGIQTFNGNLTYQAGATVNWELIANTTGSAGTSYDQIIMPAGNLTFAGSTTLALSFDGDGSTVDWSNPFWAVNRAWIVYDLSPGTTNGIGNLTLGGSLLDAQGDALSPTERGYFTTSLTGQDVMLNFVAVPEPSTWAMALAGLAAGGFLMRRRHRSP